MPAEKQENRGGGKDVGCLMPDAEYLNTDVGMCVCIFPTYEY